MPMTKGPMAYFSELIVAYIQIGYVKKILLEWCQQLNKIRQMIVTQVQIYEFWKTL